jgi:acyl-coenzyme A thioesterase PaaI-like protein
LSQNTVTSQSKPATDQRVIALWKRFGKTASGRRLFNFLLARAVPYSGTIKPQVLSIDNGHVKIALKDRRIIRNHLNSVHAIALANLGELASGLAMLSKIDSDTRAIVVNLEIEYLKKARGELLAEGRANPPDVITESTKTVVEADITD